MWYKGKSARKIPDYLLRSLFKHLAVWPHLQLVLKWAVCVDIPANTAGKCTSRCERYQVLSTTYRGDQTSARSKYSPHSVYSHLANSAEKSKLTPKFAVRSAPPKTPTVPPLLTSHHFFFLLFHSIYRSCKLRQKNARHHFCCLPGKPHKRRPFPLQWKVNPGSVVSSLMILHPSCLFLLTMQPPELVPPLCIGRVTNLIQLQCSHKWWWKSRDSVPGTV